MGYDKDHQILIEYKESGISLSVNERAGIDKLKDSIQEDKDIQYLLKADMLYSICKAYLEVMWSMNFKEKEKKKKSKYKSILKEIF